MFRSPILRCGGRRGGQRARRGGSGLTSGRLVGSFKEGRSYRGEIFRKEGLPAMYSLSLSRWSSSASTDDSRRLTGWSASDGGQVEKRVFDRRVFYSRLLAHPNWPLPPFNVVISLLVFRPSRPRARASLISLVSKGIFQ